MYRAALRGMLSELVREDRIKGISELRDESSLEEPVSLVIEVKRDADHEVRHERAGVPAIVAGAALSAWLFGDQTAWMLGRVTLNPVKHIDPIGTVLVPGVLFLLQAPFLFGWAKPVPVNFANLRHPRPALYTSAPPVHSSVSQTDEREIRALVDGEGRVAVRVTPGATQLERMPRGPYSQAICSVRLLSPPLAAE